MKNLKYVSVLFCALSALFLSACASTEHSGIVEKRIYLSTPLAVSPDKQGVKGLNAFVAAYHQQVYDLLKKVGRLQVAPDDSNRFLILEASEGNYVQCLLHDNNTQAYCEIASGLWLRPPKLILSLQKQKAVAKLGFILKDDKSNYSLDIDDASGPQGLWNVSDLMLETLYRIYDAQTGHVTASYPTIVRIAD